MADLTTSEFVVDEVSTMIREAVEKIIGGNIYQVSKVPQWTNTTVEHILSQLTKQNKNLKYVVSCVIMQKNGAGLHTASSCYWDNTTDGARKTLLNLFYPLSTEEYIRTK